MGSGLVGRPPKWRDWLKAAKVSKIDLERGPRFSSMYLALEAAQAGHGVALAPAPLVEGWPVPTVMIVGGALLGIVLAILAKFIAAAAARARGSAARKRLRASVAAVAEDLVVEPVALEVSRLASFHKALQAAR